MSKIPKKTRTQKFIMGVIVACDFCAKPSVTVVFTRRQWIFLLLCYLLCVFCELSTESFSLLERLLKQSPFYHSGLCSGPAWCRVEEWSKLFVIAWSFFTRFGWKAESSWATVLDTPIYKCPIWDEDPWQFFYKFGKRCFSPVASTVGGVESSINQNAEW